MSGQQPVDPDQDAQRSLSAAHHLAVLPGEAWRSGSPPASPAGQIAVAGAGGVERELHSSAAAAAMPGGGGSQAGASDISRLSIDSHHSYMSHRSRWSSAATVATTVAPTAAQRQGHYDPPLPEELSGGSSGEATPVTTAAGSTHSRSAAAAAMGAGPGGSDCLPRSTSSPRHGGGSASSSRMGSRNSRSTTAVALASPLDVAAAVADGGDGTSRLPPRLIVFHPDGETFGIGVDKAREDELTAAGGEPACCGLGRTEAAAAQRLP